MLLIVSILFKNHTMVGNDNGMNTVFTGYKALLSYLCYNTACRQFYFWNSFPFSLQSLSGHDW